tara:strand:+ start:758 stop:1471 length:714 start_codon:yes stop_codon:yes gene_type:complete
MDDDLEQPIYSISSYNNKIHNRTPKKWRRDSKETSVDDLLEYSITENPKRRVLIAKSTQKCNTSTNVATGKTVNTGVSVPNQTDIEKAVEDDKIAKTISENVIPPSRLEELSRFYEVEVGQLLVAILNDLQNESIAPSVLRKELIGNVRKFNRMTEKIKSNHTTLHTQHQLLLNEIDDNVNVSFKSKQRKRLLSQTYENEQYEQMLDDTRTKYRHNTYYGYIMTVSIICMIGLIVKK